MHSGRRRAQPRCEPVRLRATITMDIEARDHVDVEAAKTSIEATFVKIRELHESANLEFKQRRLRARPRPGAPGPVVAAYLDD